MIDVNVADRDDANCIGCTIKGMLMRQPVTGQSHGQTGGQKREMPPTKATSHSDHYPVNIQPEPIKAGYDESRLSVIRTSGTWQLQNGNASAGVRAWAIQHRSVGRALTLLRQPNIKAQSQPSASIRLLHNEFLVAAEEKLRKNGMFR